MKLFTLARLRKRPNGPFKTARWPLQQQAAVCRLLADQLASGFSLRQALRFLRTTTRRLPADLGQIEADLAAGTPFLTCLTPHLQANVAFQLQLTAANGDLGAALAHAATFLRLLAQQRRRLRQLLAYPLGLLGGMGGLLGALQWGVLPQLQSELALQTGLAQPTWPGIWGVLGGGLVASIGLLLRWWWRLPSLRRASRCLHWPLVGPIFQTYYAYYLAATLSQLLASGLSVQQMLAQLRQLPPRALLRQLAEHLQQRLGRGQFPVGWLQRQAYVPQQILVFLQQGSPRPQLTRELTAYSRLQYQELVRLSERALSWVQPVLLTLVAGLIVTAYLRLLLPLYQNLQGVYQ